MGFEVGVGEAARLAAMALVAALVAASVAASLDSVGSQRDDPAAR